MNLRRVRGHINMAISPQVSARPQQPYFGLRRQVTDTVQQAVDGAFPELFRQLGAHRVDPAGPPFIRFVGIDDDGEPTELELGVPVQPDAATATLPAGHYATLVHVGPYRHESEPDLATAREALLGWIETQGLTPGTYMEEYRIGPVEERDWAKWETELAFLVK
jgi:GyrI-like small molecule binding domain